MNAIELLKEYETWEANLIKDTECWEWNYPTIEGEHFDKFLELQEKRNKILKAEQHAP